jgi:hypothetical protein
VKKPIVEKLHDEIQKILMMPDVREHFAVGGAETTPMSIRRFSTQRWLPRLERSSTA